MGQSKFREHRFPVQDGLQLYARSYGERRRGRTPVVCLPGLTRNSRDFHELAGFLASPAAGGLFVLSLDSRGRGGSERDHDKTRYTIAVETSDLIAACAYFGIKKAIFIGTSRGGLILHHLVGLAPALIAGVILNDIGPVIEMEGLMRIRDYLNAATTPKDWASAPRYLKSLHGRDFPILPEHDWQEMAKAIYRDEGGVPVADFDPAIAAPLQTLTADTSLPDLWPQFEVLTGLPLMVVRGEHSKLLSEATVEEMKRRHPNLMAVTAAGQGHAPLLHFDGPKQAIATFLQR
ncbi:alpha/beta fold hydrolase [Sinorhizobium mexicanum]|uniref:Alpha/beta hydrolase n=1 Tax=Sinorhizobium mexicanum TaxID=375549 RepID=A0A859QE37_9HYPH|nr:alpha/beta hydrolase [Sinorhizobium mexicanum]MBP1882860.1 pimeloyl-ACP methyl ester carboxylesterase [Sinorhizobium mexicanum]QLL60994.1 alpha/beta hydrolase [Sinorhizobium mexicanum]